MAAKLIGVLPEGRLICTLPFKPRTDVCLCLWHSGIGNISPFILSVFADVVCPRLSRMLATVLIFRFDMHLSVTLHLLTKTSAVSHIIIPVSMLCLVYCGKMQSPGL